MSTYKQDHEALQARVEQQQQEAMDAKHWLTFLEKHREVVPCEGNFQIVKSYFAGEPLSLETLEEAVQNPNLKRQMVFQTSVEDRTKLLETLKKLTGEIPPTTVYQSTEEIRSKVEEIQRRKELEKKSPDALRAIIKANTIAPEPASIPAEWTRERLLDLKGPEFRRVVERYGSKAVTERLNQR